MTAQIAESLVYQGEKVSMCTEPLADYFALCGQKPKFQAVSTALWRGYVGTWEIVQGRLYLIGLQGTLEDGTKATLETLFPGHPERVFAHWYIGTIRIPRGKRLAYVHGGYNSTYERDEMLEFEHGLVRQTWVRDNRQGQ